MSDKEWSDTDLLWDCFVNWAETLEKIRKGRKLNKRFLENLKPDRT